MRYAYLPDALFPTLTFHFLDHDNSDSDEDEWDDELDDQELDDKNPLTVPNLQPGMSFHPFSPSFLRLPHIVIS